MSALPLSNRDRIQNLLPNPIPLNLHTTSDHRDRRGFGTRREMGESIKTSHRRDLKFVKNADFESTLGSTHRNKHNLLIHDSQLNMKSLLDNKQRRNFRNNVTLKPDITCSQFNLATKRQVAQLIKPQKTALSNNFKRNVLLDIE